MTRTALLSDVQWGRIAPLMSSSGGQRGRPFRDHRQVLEGIVFPYRAGISWRDLPACFGPWQTVWKRHRRLSSDGTWDRIHTRLLAEADAAERSTGRSRWTPRSTAPTSTARTWPGTQGAGSNYKNLQIEPDHGLGRSRGGLSTKVHHLADGAGRPLVVLIGPGQGGDSPMFPVLLEQLRVNRPGRGRPRTRPDRVRGDKACSSRANRELLRSRGIRAAIPERADQIGH
jgi:transposase